MQKPIVVSGRLTGPTHIELDEPVNEVSGELVVRLIRQANTTPAQDVFEFVESLPPGTRSMEDILKQVAEERDAWE